MNSKYIYTDKINFAVFMYWGHTKFYLGKFLVLKNVWKILVYKKLSLNLI